MFRDHGDTGHNTEAGSVFMLRRGTGGALLIRMVK